MAIVVDLKWRCVLMYNTIVVASKVEKTTLIDVNMKTELLSTLPNLALTIAVFAHDELNCLEVDTFCC